MSTSYARLKNFLPERKDMLEGTIYLSTYWKAVNYLCPCGCGGEVYLPFVGEHPHLWGFQERDGIITITPSVQETGRCRSHYLIQNNKVVWA